MITERYKLFDDDECFIDCSWSYDLYTYCLNLTYFNLFYELIESLFCFLLSWSVFNLYLILYSS